MANTSSSISLPHALTGYADMRARQLNIRRNVYLAILLSNYLNGPSIPLPVAADQVDQKHKRVPMQATMPVALRREGQKAATKWGFDSFSALMESLILYDAQREKCDDTLLIHPVRGKPSPRLRGR